MPESRLHGGMQPEAGVAECPAAAMDDFDALVRQHWPRIFRFALASLRDRDGAETVAQDCFVRAHKNRALFRGECSLQTWLMQIAVNLVRDRARSRRLQFWKRAVEIGPWIPDGNLSPEARASAKQQIAAVWHATARLSERQRTVFLLRFVEDMSIAEIAAATGMKEGTVKIHLFRALEAVRQRLRRMV
jgi:RNA polymerase sigma-70 factor, ECF subfamily